MAKPKKQTREERLRKKRLAEKKRYKRIKNNDDLWKENQEKNRRSYIRRKEEKKQLPINDMTSRHQRLQRQRWRKIFRSYYLRKKQEKLTATILAENTPPQSPSILSDVEFNLQDINIRPQTPTETRELESPVPGPSRTSRSMSQQNNDLVIIPSNATSPSCSSATLSSAVRRIRYKKDNEKHQQVQSFCTVSECLRHDISAVWAHIVPVLEFIGEIKTNIHTVHFISDSPSSQYRNKKIFHLIPCLNIYLDTIQTITWTGHGKGAPDGIGAVMKRTADRAVSQGQDIKDLDDFLRIMDQNLKTVKLRTVSEYDVSEKDFLFPQNVKSFPGCLKMHQLVWNSNSHVIAVRTLSCTVKDCLYQAVNCNHLKHLGFYQLEDRCQRNIPITLLGDSTRILREIDETFWNNSNVSKDTNTNTNQTNNRTTHFENESTLSPNEELTINIRQKHKVVPPKRKFMKHAPKKVQNNNINAQRETICNKSNNKDKYEEKEKNNSVVEQNMESAGTAELDSLSEITFTRNGNKKFSIDLQNIKPYFMESDDDDFDIF